MNRKETFYLKHDYNSRNDERVLRLRAKYPNGTGYAIYWMILEKLAESSEGRLNLSDLDVIAFELQMESKWIADVVHDSGLFEKDGVFFWSNRLLEDMTERQEKSKKAVLANKIRWDKDRKKAKYTPNGVQMESIYDPNGIQGEEKRGEENIEKIYKKEKSITEEFFGNLEKQEELITHLSEEKGIPRDQCAAQIKKFISYWTEKNPSGKKQRWQMQKVFEVNRRLATWFSNAQEFEKKTSGLKFSPSYDFSNAGINN